MSTETPKRAWIKPTASSTSKVRCDDVKTIDLNTAPATEDAAIAAGWYPADKGTAGSAQQAVPEPDWLKEANKAKGKGAAKDGAAKEK